MKKTGIGLVVLIFPVSSFAKFSSSSSSSSNNDDDDDDNNNNNNKCDNCLPRSHCFWAMVGNHICNLAVLKF